MGTYCIGEHLIYERFIPISNYVYALYTCIDNIGLPRISMGGGEREEPMIIGGRQRYICMYSKNNDETAWFYPFF